MTAAEALALKDCWLCPWGWTEPRIVVVMRETAPLVVVILDGAEHAVNPGNLYATAAEADRVALVHARAEEDRLVRLLATVRDAVRRLTGRCLAADIPAALAVLYPAAPDPDDEPDIDATPLENDVTRGHLEPAGVAELTESPQHGSRG